MSSTTLPTKKTKIVCTIGPASNKQETLERMIRAGMNVARLNFAHGDRESHQQIIRNLRAASQAVGQSIAIMGDLPGPKMRIGLLANETIELERDQPFIISTDDFVGDQNRVSLNFPGLQRAVKQDDRIFINDGLIELCVQHVEGSEIHTRVEVGGELRSFKGVNFPGIDLGISAFTDEDRDFLAFAAEEKLDAVSQSFVQSAEDIDEVRKFADSLNYHPLLIAKLERVEAVKNLDGILSSADGIMVARGDLGVEVPIERMTVIQKKMIFQANLAGKPVITATQMLESMTEQRRPTRAEATDVANAILDGTDCVMLSGETAVGRFPVETVAMMAKIAQYTETNRPQNMVADTLEDRMEGGEIDEQDLIALSIYLTVQKLQPSVVFSPTVSGETARRVARFRLPVWIIAASPRVETAQKLQFTYGVYPEYLPGRPDSWQLYVRNRVKQYDINGSLALLTRGTSPAHKLGANLLELIDLETSDLDPVW